jgi:hypothetical protein
MRSLPGSGVEQESQSPFSLYYFKSDLVFPFPETNGTPSTNAWRLASIEAFLSASKMRALSVARGITHLARAL